jgi:hypothetical protein
MWGPLLPGAAQLLGGGATVTPASLDTTTAFGSPVITLGVAPSSLTTTTTFGAPTLAASSRSDGSYTGGGWTVPPQHAADVERERRRRRRRREEAEALAVGAL